MKIIDKIDRKIEEMNNRIELLIVILLSSTLVFGIVFGMGTLMCGYHLVDDHQILQWAYEMNYEKQSVWEIIKRELIIDFSIRYRPAYIITHILKVKLLGTDLIYHSIIKALETLVSCIFLYYCGRHMGAKKVYSFLFATASLLGYQSATWWKLGTHEIQGTLLFAIGFYCLLKWLEDHKIYWAISSVILFAMMANYKESFILLAPFIMLYIVYFELQKEKEFNCKILWKCICRNLGYLIALGVVFLIPVIIITCFVGTNNYDMIGVDTSVPLANYLTAIINSLQTDLKWYKRFGILFILILLTYWDHLKKLWKEILLLIAFLLPQFVIYGQSGICERYILPSSIGFAFFFIIIVSKWKPLSGRRRVVYVLGILLLIAAHGRVAIREADYFRYRGESITTMLETVQNMSEEKSNIKVLSCFRPNEEGNLTLYYWMLNHGFDNVYYWTEDDQIINRIVDINLNYADDRYIEQNFEDMDVIVMYNQEDRHWCYSPSLDLTNFTEQKCGTLTIYVRNDSGITSVDTKVEGLKINF